VFNLLALLEPDVELDQKYKYADAKGAASVLVPAAEDAAKGFTRTKVQTLTQKALLAYWCQ
jgi:hypothetical protein